MQVVVQEQVIILLAQMDQGDQVVVAQLQLTVQQTQAAVAEEQQHLPQHQELAALAS